MKCLHLSISFIYQWAFTGCMTHQNDIYNYTHKLDVAKEKLKNAAISDRNKDFITRLTAPVSWKDWANLDE